MQLVITSRNAKTILFKLPLRQDMNKIAVSKLNGKGHPYYRSCGLEGVRGIALPVLDLSARRGWVVSTTPRPLYPGK
jgi:hypothetical protein